MEKFLRLGVQFDKKLQMVRPNPFVPVVLACVAVTGVACDVYSPSARAEINLQFAQGLKQILGLTPGMSLPDLQKVAVAKTYSIDWVPNNNQKPWNVGTVLDTNGNPFAVELTPEGQESTIKAPLKIEYPKPDPQIRHEITIGKNRLVIHGTLATTGNLETFKAELESFLAGYTSTFNSPVELHLVFNPRSQRPFKIGTFQRKDGKGADVFLPPGPLGTTIIARSANPTPGARIPDIKKTYIALDMSNIHDEAMLFNFPIEELLIETLMNEFAHALAESALDIAPKNPGYEHFSTLFAKAMTYDASLRRSIFGDLNEKALELIAQEMTRLRIRKQSVRATHQPPLPFNVVYPPPPGFVPVEVNGRIVYVNQYRLAQKEMYMRGRTTAGINAAARRHNAHVREVRRKSAGFFRHSG